MHLRIVICEIGVAWCIWIFAENLEVFTKYSKKCPSILKIDKDFFIDGIDTDN